MIPVIGRATWHFDQAVRAYSGELFHFALWLTRDPHRAEDVLQESLTRAWRSWGRVKDESARKAWLYAIVRNEFYRESGKARGREEVSDDQMLADIPDERDFTLALEARDFLRRLPAALIEPLVLQAIGGLTCEEVAEILDVSVGAAMTRLSRARTAVRRLAKDSVERPALAQEMKR